MKPHCQSLLYPNEIKRMQAGSQCFDISKLDYCNMHLYVLPGNTFKICQRIQNYAAHIVARCHNTCVA